MGNAIQKDNFVRDFEVAKSDKAEVLSVMFLQHGDGIEQLIQLKMKELTMLQSENWKCIKLSNAGFFMHLPGAQHIRVGVKENYFCSVMSVEAAGIVACLIVYSEISKETNSRLYADHFNLLREYALQHEEAAYILRAIDGVTIG